MNYIVAIMRPADRSPVSRVSPTDADDYRSGKQLQEFVVECSAALSASGRRHFDVQGRQTAIVCMPVRRYSVVSEQGLQAPPIFLVFVTKGQSAIDDLGSPSSFEKLKILCDVCAAQVGQ